MSFDKKAYLKKYYLANKKRQAERAKENYLRHREERIAKAQKYYAENKEEVKKRGHKYYTNNKEEISKRQKKYAQSHREGHKKSCKKYRQGHQDKIKAYDKKYVRDKKEQMTIYRKKWRSNKDNAKSEKLWDRFKITLQQFKDMIASQNNLCGICGKILNEPCIDHNHKTKKIRGLLCRKCNGGIGGLNDDVHLIIKALEWVKRTAEFKNTMGSETNFKFNPQYKYLLKREYGLTSEQFYEMITQQKNKCGICNTFFSNKPPFNPNVDHDHNNEKIRGLLCGKCNRAIGLLNDDPVVISNAIDWLKKEQQ